jgi:hypothetical protein
MLIRESVLMFMVQLINSLIKLTEANVQEEKLLILEGLVDALVEVTSRILE